MKIKNSLMVAAIATLCGAAHAGHGIFVGVGYTRDAGLALTFKVLHTNEQNHAVAAAGVSYYPNASKKLGADLGLGYQAKHATVIASWDFLQENPQISAGWSNSKRKTEKITPPPYIPPPP